MGRCSSISGAAGRRAILSTGMAEPAEIATALDVLAWGYLGRAAPARIEAVKGARTLPAASALLKERVSPSSVHDGVPGVV